MTQELLADLRSRINPAYQDVRGTESHERKQCADAIEALQGECAEHKENAIRNARQAVAFRAERDQLQSKLDALEKQEPIYQYQMGDGSWIDQTKHSYDYNRNHAPNAVVRIVYAAPKALAPEPLTDKRIKAALAAWFDERIAFKGFDGRMRAAIEAAHGIGGAP